MASICAIATHAPAARRRAAVRLAVVARRAVLGDCANVRDHARAVFSRRYWRRPACVVPMGLRSGRGASAADLAVTVARRLLDANGHRLRRDAVAALIYCHDAPDERISESTAGRLQYELGLTAANPFAVSQAHGVAVWIALDLALGLVEGPEAADAVLVVASDKLVFGGPQADMRRLVFGDTAAAALVRGGEAGSWSIDHLSVRQFATACDALAPWPSAEVDAFAAFGAGVIGATLEEAGIDAEGLETVLATTPDARLADGVHAASGLPAAADARTEGSSSDPLFALAAIEASTPAGARVLAWSAGNNGEFACCVLKRL
ncbi:MAG: hypothetical protein ABW032_07705 [Burkholderiaceae bacterium]